MLYVHDTIIVLVFFFSSCLSSLVGTIRFWVFALVFVTRISKNAFCPFHQTFLALISGLAPFPVKNIFPVYELQMRLIFNITVYLFHQIYFKSLILFCLIIINPHRLEISVWLKLCCWPPGHWEGKWDEMK